MFVDWLNKSPQEIFDHVAEHLLTQNQRAVGRAGRCEYFTDGGLQCAVGCLIDPSEFVQDMNRFDLANFLATFYPEIYNAARYANVDDAIAEKVDLLELLQRVHDHTEPDFWPLDLRHTAQKFNLSYEKMRVIS